MSPSLTPRSFYTFLTALFLFSSIGLSCATAQTESPLDGFTHDTFNDTEKTINAIIVNRVPNAAIILDALANGRLLFDKNAHSLYLQQGDGSVKPLDGAAPQSGQDLSNLKVVRLNNRVRRSLDTARATLDLFATDRNIRLAAARTLFHSPESGALTALTAALAQEKDGEVATALSNARAAIIATDESASEPDRLNAVEILGAKGDEESATLLSDIAAKSTGALQTRATSALGSVRARLQFWNNIQNVWYGLSLGSVLLLAAIGLAITFGVMGVINMAHGEMVMIGAYVTFAVQQWLRSHDPSLFDASLLISLPIAFLTTGAIGVVVERSIIRFLYGRPLETLLATFGLSLILQQAVRTIFGADNRDVGAPSYMAGTFNLGGLSITYGRMWIILFALLVFFALQILLRATTFGLQMRAVTQNRAMASSMGISTDRIDALAFGLGSGIAGIAGVALSQIDNVSPNLGQSYIIDSFMVVVFGGVGNLWGAFVAALTLGVANKFLEPYIGAVLGKIALLVFIILFIQKRPRGLFALKGRAVES